MDPSQALVGPAQHAMASWMCKTFVHGQCMVQRSKIIALQAYGFSQHCLGASLTLRMSECCLLLLCNIGLLILVTC